MVLGNTAQKIADDGLPSGYIRIRDAGRLVITDDFVACVLKHLLCTSYCWDGWDGEIPGTNAAASFAVDIVRCQPMPQLAPPPAAPSNVRVFLRCALTGRVSQ